MRDRLLRESAYERFFGPMLLASHEVVPQAPHIDVLAFGPQPGGRPFHTLATSGMSDRAMHWPRKGIDLRREIVLYCDRWEAAHVDFVRTIARYPFANDTWVEHGVVVPAIGEPLLSGTAMTHLLLLTPVMLRPDCTLGDTLKIGGDPVHFLWPVPITDAELELYKAKGLPAIGALFDQHGLQPTFDPGRRSFV